MDIDLQAYNPTMCMYVLCKRERGKEGGKESENSHYVCKETQARLAEVCPVQWDSGV